MKSDVDVTIEPALYRQGMARYAGHVQLVTTEWQGVRRGVTVTAACSVSDDPPTVLVCLNSENPRNSIFDRSGIFALNALSSAHEELAKAFAGFAGLDDEQRFSLDRWTRLSTGAPVLDDAAAVFDCRIAEIKQMSTHFIMFGRVEALKLGAKSQPLIYHERGFRRLP